MKIFCLEWNSYCNEDMVSILKEEGHEVVLFPFSDEPGNENFFSEEKMEQGLRQAGKVDFVFSFNYFPPVSEICQKKKLKYVSWVYDSPYINLYSPTLKNPCNYVFIFDKELCLELCDKGMDTVYYLPMAVNLKRLDSLIPNREIRKLLDTDIAFVGSLYMEEKHNLYGRFEGADPYVKGYMDGLIDAQRKVYGYNFLQESLPREVLQGMKQTNELYSNNPGAATDNYIYGEYVLARRVTALERKEIITMLSEKYRVQLHTNDEKAVIGKAQNMGPIHYYEGMPFVFKTAKINLNITLRSIKSGIPLRAMDVMGCGGFLLTNYQADFFDFFVPDEDFVFYQDYNDLMEKTEYYLTHEKERQEIAANGHEKMKEHTFQNRIREIMEILFV